MHIPKFSAYIYNNVTGHNLPANEMVGNREHYRIVQDALNIARGEPGGINDTPALDNFVIRYIDFNPKIPNVPQDHILVAFHNVPDKNIYTHYDKIYPKPPETPIITFILQTFKHLVEKYGNPEQNGDQQPQGESQSQ